MKMWGRGGPRDTHVRKVAGALDADTADVLDAVENAEHAEMPDNTDSFFGIFCGKVEREYFGSSADDIVCGGNVKPLLLRSMHRGPGEEVCSAEPEHRDRCQKPWAPTKDVLGKPPKRKARPKMFSTEEVDAILGQDALDCGCGARRKEPPPERSTAHQK